MNASKIPTIPIKEIEFYVRDKRTNKTGWISFSEILDVLVEEIEKEFKEKKDGKN
ncbi:hypothetical protein CCP3SC1AL1_520009 [Gammaproteobacteria bacterium]